MCKVFQKKSTALIRPSSFLCICTLKCFPDIFNSDDNSVWGSRYNLVDSSWFAGCNLKQSEIYRRLVLVKFLMKAHSKLRMLDVLLYCEYPSLYNDQLLVTNLFIILGQFYIHKIKFNKKRSTHTLSELSSFSISLKAFSLFCFLYFSFSVCL